MTTDSRNGAAEISSTASDAGEVSQQENTGRESGPERVGREGGLSLFGTEKGHAALKDRLVDMMGGKGPSREDRAAAANVDDGVERNEVTETGTESQTHEGSEESEIRNPEDDGAEGAPEEGTEEGAAEGDESTEEERQWPKPAVAEISKLRKARREAREEAERYRGEVTELRARLESGELQRPVAPSRESPLAFANNEAELSAWEENAGRWVDLAEEALESDGHASEELVAWAKRNGAWDSENEGIDRGRLRQSLREARTGLSKHAPDRRTFLRERALREQQVDQDPVLGAVWKDKGSEAYRDAMGVIGNVPGIRSLPHMRAAAAIYALGLREYRRQMAARGRTGAGAGGAGNGNGAAGAGPKPKVQPPKNVVKGPGRTVVLPRNPPANAVPGQQARDKVRQPGATTRDYEDYARQAVLGMIGAPR